MRGTIVCLTLAGLLVFGAPARADEKKAEAKPRVVPKGKRELGVHISEAADGDFGRAYAHAMEAGTDVVGLSVAWDEIERTPGVFKSKWLPIANAFYGPRKMKVALVLKTLDTVRKRFPEDLRSKPYDDPLVLKRFERFLTYVMNAIPNVQLSSLSLGNEVDGVLGADPKAWAAYTRFFETGRAHLKKRHPALAVGVTVMYGGLTGPMKAQTKALNRLADVILLTYYPLKGDFKIQPLAHLDAAFQSLTTLYPKRPIHFGEIGCPSGTIMGSSLEHQARFVERMFQLWDRYHARVPHMSYCWLTDTSKAALETYKTYYGSANPRFIDYLATLGLRTHAGSGEDKPAWKVFKREAKARGF